MKLFDDDLVVKVFDDAILELVNVVAKYAIHG
jgi:hypothetical protein